MLHNNLFLTNLDELAVQLMPTRWRKPVHIAFVKLLIFPFKEQLEKLKVERAKNIYTLIHDARVGLVEKMLNDRFDQTGRSIKIGEGNRISNLFLYQETEPLQTYLPQTIFTQQEISERNTDFVVLVPTALGLPSGDIKVMEYLTKYYTGKDKKFKIEFI